MLCHDKLRPEFKKNTWTIVANFWARDTAYYTKLAFWFADYEENQDECLYGDKFWILIIFVWIFNYSVNMYTKFKSRIGLCNIKSLSNRTKINKEITKSDGKVASIILIY